MSSNYFTSLYVENKRHESSSVNSFFPVSPHTVTVEVESAKNILSSLSRPDSFTPPLTAESQHTDYIATQIRELQDYYFEVSDSSAGQIPEAEVTSKYICENENCGKQFVNKKNFARHRQKVGNE
jgi:hypothetical protein